MQLFFICNVYIVISELLILNRKCFYISKVFKVCILEYFHYLLVIVGINYFFYILSFVNIYNAFLRFSEIIAYFGRYCNI